jgi:hypothetical protein
MLNHDGLTNDAVERVRLPVVPVDFHGGFKGFEPEFFDDWFYFYHGFYPPGLLYPLIRGKVVADSVYHPGGFLKISTGVFREYGVKVTRLTT